jgi:hypothetical protein
LGWVLGSLNLVSLGQDIFGQIGFARLYGYENYGIILNFMNAVHHLVKSLLLSHSWFFLPLFLKVQRVKVNVTEKIIP